MNKKVLEEEYIRERKSIQKIALENNCGYETIRRYMVKYNISRRTHKEISRGKNNSNFKGWKSSKKYYCIEKNCNNEIHYSNFLYGNKRCRSCSAKGKRNNSYIDGRTDMVYYCIEEKCNNRISYDNFRKGNGRCYFCSNRGERNASYIDGRSWIEYPKEFNDKLKEKIRKRDEYTCQNCSITEEEHIIVFGKILFIHHIDYNKKNCKENNLITVCLSCNTRANYNRNYWENHYTSNLKLLGESV